MRRIVKRVAPAAVAIALVAAGVTVSGQETASGKYPSLSEPPEAAHGLILDKPQIAKETYGRLRGLREAGNPHIRRGLLLRQIQTDPERSEVDREALREAHIRRIERREKLAHDPAPYLAHVVRQPPASSTAEGRPMPAPRRGTSPIAWIAGACCAAVLLIALALRILR